MAGGCGYRVDTGGLSERNRGVSEMSYCRFGEGDVYLYNDVNWGLTCMACKLADLVSTVFTTGGVWITGYIQPCEYCNGHGCKKCMLHGHTQLENEQEAFDHLLEHRQMGHNVPQHAFDRLWVEIIAIRNKESEI